MQQSVVNDEGQALATPQYQPTSMQVIFYWICAVFGMASAIAALVTARQALNEEMGGWIAQVVSTHFLQLTVTIVVVIFSFFFWIAWFFGPIAFAIWATVKWLEGA